MTLERNSQTSSDLLNGAIILGAGRTLGFTDDETIEAKRATRRREQRERRESRGQREGNRAAAEEFLAQDDASFKQKGSMTQSELAALLGSNIGAEIDDEGWAFGEDTGSFANGEGRRPQDDDQSYTRDEKVRNDVLGSDFLQEQELAMQNEGRSRAQTGLGGMRDALKRLQQAKDTFGFDAFGAEGAEMERLYYRLQDQLGDGQQKVRMQAEARRANERDQRQANVLQQIANEIKAEKEAVSNLRSSGFPMQMDVNNIVEVRKLGGAGHASHDPNYKAAGNYQVVRAQNPHDFGTAIPLTDKDGQIREYYGYEGRDLVQLGEVNVDSTDQAINAPKPTPGQSWVSQYLPTYGKPGGTTFGYPQVGINEEMSLLGDRIRGLKGYGYESIGNPRTLAEFEQAMGAVVARGQSQGDTFWRYDDALGKAVAAPAPGVDDVLYKLGYSANDKSRLANALFQSQAAQVVDVNQDDKQAFVNRGSRTVNEREDVNLDVGEMRPDGGTALDKIKNEKVGRGKKSKSVRAELSRIDGEGVVNALAQRGELMVTTPGGQQVLSPEAAQAILGAKQARGDAQMPLFGNVAGETVDKVRYIRGTARDTGESALIERYGPAQGMAAAETERRFKEDERLRAEKASQTTDPIAVEQRKRDAQIESKKAQMQYDDEVREKDELIKLMKRGATQPGGFDLGQTIGGRPRVIEAAPAGRKLQVPSDETFGGRTPFMVGKGNKRVPLSVAPGFQRQPTQEASVPMSIAPDPGTPTGNQPAPMVDAGGAGQQPPTRTAVAGGPMPDDIRKELFSLPNESGSTYMSSPEGTGSQRDAIISRIKKGATNAASKAEEFRTSPKYQRGRRISYTGGVGLAALGTILNLSDNREEEEQMR